VKAEKVKPLGNWVFLRMEPRRERIGLIHLPGEKTGVEKVGYNVACVLKAGPGVEEDKKGVISNFQPQRELQPGVRVIVRDFHSDYHPIDVEEDGKHFLIHFNDVEAILAEGASLGEWSGIQDAQAS